MSTSKHWLEEGAPPDFERLLRASRSEEPAAAGVERALLAAGIVGATSLASGTAVGATGGTVTKLLVGAATKWIAIGVLGAGAVVATVELVEHRRPDAPEAVPTAAPGRSRSAPLPSHSATTLDELPPPVPTTQNVPPTDAPASKEPGTIIERSVVPPRASSAGLDRTLTEEMVLIDAARSSLRRGDAVGAVRSATDYNRRFAAGRFAPEALFLLMQARVELGQRQAAADLAREIIRRYPNGAQVGRARELLKLEEARQNP